MDTIESLFHNAVTPAVRRFAELYERDELIYLPTICGLVEDQLPELTQGLETIGLRRRVAPIMGLGFAKRDGPELTIALAAICATAAIVELRDELPQPSLQQIQEALRRAARELGASAPRARSVAVRLGPLLCDTLSGVRALTSPAADDTPPVRMIQFDTSGELRIDGHWRHPFKGQTFLLFAEFVRRGHVHWADAVRLFREWHANVPKNPVKELGQRISKICQPFRQYDLELKIEPSKLAGKNSGEWQLRLPEGTQLAGNIVDAARHAEEAARNLEKSDFQKAQKLALDAVNQDPDSLKAYLVLGSLAREAACSDLPTAACGQALRQLKNTETGVRAALEAMDRFETLHGNNKVHNAVRERLERENNQIIDARIALENRWPREPLAIGEHELGVLDEAFSDIRNASETTVNEVLLNYHELPTVRDVVHEAVNGALKILPLGRDGELGKYRQAVMAAFAEHIRLRETRTPSSYGSLADLKRHWTLKIVERTVVQMIEERWGLTEKNQRDARAWVSRHGGDRSTAQLPGAAEVTAEERDAAAKYGILQDADRQGRLNLNAYWNVYRHGKHRT